MTGSSPRLLVREFSGTDYAFVITTWLRSARERSYHAPGSGAWAKVILERSTFYDLNRPLAEWVLGGGGTTLVVCDAIAPDVIAGWSSYVAGVCVWAYTVDGLRGSGVWKLSKKEAEARGLYKPKPAKPRARKGAPATEK